MHAYRFPPHNDITYSEPIMSCFTSSADYMQYLQKLGSGHVLPVAVVGPGSERGVDWWVALRVDEEMTGSRLARKEWVVLQGQTKKRDKVGKSAPTGTLHTERSKQLELDDSVESVFVLVTAERVQDVPGPQDVVLDCDNWALLFWGGGESAEAVDWENHAGY